MAATTNPTYPTWDLRENGSFTLRLSVDASFGGSQEGSTYYVTLPGHGLRKCWNRAEVERVCRDYLDQLEACPVEDDDADESYGIPTDESLRRWHNSRVL